MDLNLEPIEQNRLAAAVAAAADLSSCLSGPPQSPSNLDREERASRTMSVSVFVVKLVRTQSRAQRVVPCAQRQQATVDLSGGRSRSNDTHSASPSQSERKRKERVSMRAADI